MVFYVGGFTRVLAHWNYCFDMHVNHLGPVSCVFFHPEFLSGYRGECNGCWLEGRQHFIYWNVYFCPHSYSLNNDAIEPGNIDKCVQSFQGRLFLTNRSGSFCPFLCCKFVNLKLLRKSQKGNVYIWKDVMVDLMEVTVSAIKMKCHLLGGVPTFSFNYSLGLAIFLKNSSHCNM